MNKKRWKKFLLRVPNDIENYLNNEALKNGSSNNSEIIRCIRQKMEKSGYYFSDDKNSYSSNRGTLND